MKSLATSPKECLQTLPVIDIVKILKISRLARLTNNELINDDDWFILAEFIQEDFPDMTQGEAQEIIKKGIKGIYDDIGKPLNFSRIYQWFKKNYISPVERKRQADIKKYAMQ